MGSFRSIGLGLSVLAGTAAGTAAGVACDSQEGSDCGPTRAVVARVVDGDTVELESGERVRYLMIDTPESTSGADDCFGAEAAEVNRELVEGKEISIAYDVQCEDRFGRLLGYVSVGDRAINQLLVQRGLACVLQIPPNGEAVAEEFEDLEAEARARMVGLWGACEDVTCD